ncbi:MAG: GMP/IMP nucleotidase [Halomonadaceae bacterium]|nr:MAG: GMP/IMP nucleotidase [Halomonadaceae bacterium]
MIDWQPVSTVLLDMDGTLLDLHYDSYFWLTHLPLRYAEQQHISPEQAKSHILERIHREQGTLNWYCVDYWSEQLQLDVASLKQEVSHKIGFRPHVQAFLRQLQRSHQRVVIVTNAHQAGLELKLARTGLASYVDAIHTSHSFGKPKEAPGFWQDLQQVEAFDPAKALLIDDSLPVLRAARDYGIGQLLAVLSPDTQAPANQCDDFAAIHHFNELLPIHSKAPFPV